MNGLHPEMFSDVTESVFHVPVEVDQESPVLDGPVLAAAEFNHPVVAAATAPDPSAVVSRFL